MENYLEFDDKKMIGNHPSVVIVRGLPGSGKTTYAKTKYPLFEYIDADQYFTDADGEYKFDLYSLDDAHSYCFSRFSDTLEKNQNVVVANTFTTYMDIKPYIELSQKYKISNILIIRLTTQYDSIHSVPDFVMQKMLDRWEHIHGEVNDCLSNISEIISCIPQFALNYSLLDKHSSFPCVRKWTTVEDIDDVNLTDILTCTKRIDDIDLNENGTTANLKRQMYLYILLNKKLCKTLQMLYRHKYLQECDKMYHVYMTAACHEQNLKGWHTIHQRFLTFLRSVSTTEDLTKACLLGLLLLHPPRQPEEYALLQYYSKLPNKITNKIHHKNILVLNDSQATLEIENYKNIDRWMPYRGPYTTKYVCNLHGHLADLLRLTISVCKIKNNFRAKKQHYLFTTKHSFIEFVDETLLDVLGCNFWQLCVTFNTYVADILPQINGHQTYAIQYDMGLVPVHEPTAMSYRMVFDQRNRNLEGRQLCYNLLKMDSQYENAIKVIKRKMNIEGT